MLNQSQFQLENRAQQIEALEDWGDLMGVPVVPAKLAPLLLHEYTHLLSLGNV